MMCALLSALLNFRQEDLQGSAPTTLHSLPKRQQHYGVIGHSLRLHALPDNVKR